MTIPDHPTRTSDSRRAPGITVEGAALHEQGPAIRWLSVRLGEASAGVPVLIVL